MMRKAARLTAPHRFGQPGHKTMKKASRRPRSTCGQRRHILQAGYLFTCLPASLLLSHLPPGPNWQRQRQKQQLPVGCQQLRELGQKYCAKCFCVRATRIPDQPGQAAGAAAAAKRSKAKARWKSFHAVVAQKIKIIAARKLNSQAKAVQPLDWQPQQAEGGAEGVETE